MNIAVLRRSREWFFTASVALTVVILSIHATARAGNILVNPGFEIGASGETVPSGWTYFDDPNIPKTTEDYWIEGNHATPHSGSFYWKEWGAGYYGTSNNVAGIYQILGAYPSNTYSASGWLYTSSADTLGANSSVWLDVSFLDASSNLLALYKSADFSAAVGTDGWFEYDVTNVCNISVPVSTGDARFPTYAITGSASQLLAPANTAYVRYRFNYLQFEGDQGSAYFDDASLSQLSGYSAPVISNMFPVDMIFVPPSNGLSFYAVSPSDTPIDNSGIQVILNGVDVSSSLSISGSSASKLVVYSGLQSNTVYSAAIKVIDSVGLSVFATNYFETTWVGIPPIQYLWEAEDFDFNRGLFYNNPTLCNSSGELNCYFGKVGLADFDENANGETGGHLYRADDVICTDVSGDLLRANLYAADRTDFEINPFDSGEWVNYTRQFTAGTYWIIGRIATDITLSGSLSLGIQNADTSVTPLGTFSITNGGLGWTHFENIYLRDANGNKVNVPLNGKVKLQLQSGGNLLPNFFALVPAIVDEPILNAMYPTGTQPYEDTNSLTFTVTSDGATFPASGINVNLDGVNVSSALAITGVGSSNITVVYAGLQQNAAHAAIITVTNSLGHGIALTNDFDTFSTNNFTVEAEDFDYNGGQFITPWSPDAYASLDATTNIDYQHSTISGEQYQYRPNGIPQALTQDTPRAIFFNFDASDYDLNWYGPGDWQNYTRVYPSGPYFVYARTAGLGNFSMALAKVTGGAGTVNQTTQTLGYWNGFGPNNHTYQWLELKSSSGAPVLVDFHGQGTFRMSTSTGDCYPNYFMLVPAGGVQITAAKQNGNVVISFPSVSGTIYRVLTQSSLNSNNWSVVTSTIGSNGVTSVTIPASGTAQYYEVVAP